MKRSVIAVIALGLMLLASSASANLIGLFADPAGTDCAGPMPLYATTSIHVVAVLDDLAGITAAEFLIDAPPFIPNVDVIVSFVWDSPLTIGDVLGDDGFSIAFSECQDGPVVHLGMINFFVIGAEWPGQNAYFCVVQTNGSQQLVLVDCQFNTVPASGWCFVANCDLPDCSCGAVPTEDASWGAIKALY